MKVVASGSKFAHTSLKCSLMSLLKARVSYIWVFMYPSRIIAIKSFRNTRLTMKKKLRKYT
jgi:hypothetical protein